jgi:WD40 repeat protein
LVVNLGAARLWSTKDLTPASPTLEHSSWIQERALDREGRCVVTLDSDSQLHGWDAETGESVFACSLDHLESHTPLNKGTARRSALLFFSPDGRLLHLVTTGGLFATIPFEPDGRRFDNLVHDIGIRTGVERDAGGGLKRFQRHELSAIWKKQLADMKQ